MTREFMFSFEGLVPDVKGTLLDRTVVWRHVARTAPDAWENAGIEASRLCDLGMHITRVNLLTTTTK
jgi:hypothetical protein